VSDWPRRLSLFPSGHRQRPCQ